MRSSAAHTRYHAEIPAPVRGCLRGQRWDRSSMRIPVHAAARPPAMMIGGGLRMAQGDVLPSEKREYREPATGREGGAAYRWAPLQRPPVLQPGGVHRRLGAVRVCFQSLRKGSDLRGGDRLRQDRAAHRFRGTAGDGRPGPAHRDRRLGRPDLRSGTRTRLLRTRPALLLPGHRDPARGDRRRVAAGVRTAGRLGSVELWTLPGTDDAARRRIAVADARRLPLSARQRDAGGAVRPAGGAAGDRLPRPPAPRTAPRPTATCSSAGATRPTCSSAAIPARSRPG